MTKQQLKPCPFCGSDGEIKRSGHSIYAMCSGCNSACISVNIFYCRSDEERDYQESCLVKQWNTRASDSQQGLINELIETIQKAKVALCNQVELKIIHADHAEETEQLADELHRALAKAKGGE